MLRWRASTWFSLGAGAATTTTPSWDYGHVDSWGSSSGPHCGDSYGQSPINVVSRGVDGSAGLSPINFQGVTYGPMDHVLQANGHSWQLNWDTTTKAFPPFGILQGGRFYALQQFHFHSPSEHQVDGIYYDMEAQFKHKCTVNCTPGTDQYLMVAVFLQTSGMADNPNLARLWPSFKQASRDVTWSLSGSFSPYDGFLPDKRDYWLYSGSTTTPPCSNGTLWMLLPNPVAISRQQLIDFRTANTQQAGTQFWVFNSTPRGPQEWDASLGVNIRPIQPLGNRSIQGYSQDADQSFLYFIGAMFVASCCGSSIICLGAFCCVMDLSGPKGKKRKLGATVYKAVQRTLSGHPGDDSDNDCQHSEEEVPLKAATTVSDRAARPGQAPAPASVYAAPPAPPLRAPSHEVPRARASHSATPPASREGTDLLRDVAPPATYMSAPAPIVQLAAPPRPLTVVRPSTTHTSVAMYPSDLLRESTAEFRSLSPARASAPPRMA